MRNPLIKNPLRAKIRNNSPSAPVSGFSAGNLLALLNHRQPPAGRSSSPSVVVSATVAKLSSKRLSAAWLTSARRSISATPLRSGRQRGVSSCFAVWRKTVEFLRLIDRGFEAKRPAFLVVHLEELVWYQNFKRVPSGLTQVDFRPPDALGGSLLAEILHDIGTTQVFDAMTHPALIPTGQVSRRMEHEIRGPFGLLGHPVVQGVQPGSGISRALNGLHEFTENCGVVGVHLSIQELLGASDVSDAHEEIVLKLKTDAAIVQLLVQPPSSVDADANGEGEVGLHADITETHSKCWK